MSVDYDKLVADAVASGKARHMAPKQIKLVLGDRIAGKFLGRELITSKNSKMPDFFVYTFERTEETVRFPVSGAFDKGQGSQLKEGGIYGLEYREKMDIGGGKTFKDIDVIVVSEPGEDIEEDEDGEENEG